jgi:hypothetical protein
MFDRNLRTIHQEYIYARAAKKPTRVRNNGTSVRLGTPVAAVDGSEVAS